MRASQGERLISSAGRAPASHAGGRRFDPVISHQPLRNYGRKSGRRAAVVQSVRIPACHAGGRGFESRPLRHIPPLTSFRSDETREAAQGQLFLCLSNSDVIGEPCTIQSPSATRFGGILWPLAFAKQRVELRSRGRVGKTIESSMLGDGPSRLQKAGPCRAGQGAADTDASDA